MQHHWRGCNNIPAFLQQTIPIAHSLCEGWTQHDLHILVTAPFCCDWKSRAACAQSFAPWQQATIEIMLAISLTIACLRYIYNGVILHAHPVCGESTQHHRRGCNRTCPIYKKLLFLQLIAKAYSSFLVLLNRTVTMRWHKSPWKIFGFPWKKCWTKCETIVHLTGPPQKNLRLTMVSQACYRPTTTASLSSWNDLRTSVLLLL